MQHARKFECKSFDAACVQCEHSHPWLEIPFACIALRVASCVNEAKMFLTAFLFPEGSSAAFLQAFFFLFLFIYFWFLLERFCPKPFHIPPGCQVYADETTRVDNTTRRARGTQEK